MSTESKPIPEIIKESRELRLIFHATIRICAGLGLEKLISFPSRGRCGKLNTPDVFQSRCFDYKPDPQTIAAESIDYLRNTFDREE